MNIQRHRMRGRRIAVCIAALVLIAFLVRSVSGKQEAKYSAYTARPSVNGFLHVENGQLTDETGMAVQLRGISTHGLTWYPDYINHSLFSQVSEDWNGNLIRLAMYSEAYCSDEKEESLCLMKQRIDLAIKTDMYVLVDWHILNDYDPNMNAEEAVGFFEEIASEYAGIPNLIFEICNEPNQSTAWSHVFTYSNRVIPVSPVRVMRKGSTLSYLMTRKSLF